MSIFLFATFFGLSIVGVPLAVALGLAGVATLTLYTPMPLDLLTQTMFSSMNSFLLVAVPLFILVGAVMERGRVAERIFDFAESMVGWLPGGLGHVNVVSSVIFSGVSGSSVADIASVGAIEIKAMERHGFPKGYAVGMTLCTSTLASIIPPSILVVIAGSIANVSIGTLLVAGLVPGLFIAFVFMVFNHFYSVLLRLQPALSVQPPHGGGDRPPGDPADADAADPDPRDRQRPVHADRGGIDRGALRADPRRHRLPHDPALGGSRDPDRDRAHLRHDPLHRRDLADRGLDLRLRGPAR